MYAKSRVIIEIIYTTYYVWHILIHAYMHLLMDLKVNVIIDVVVVIVVGLKGGGLASLARHVHSSSDSALCLQTADMFEAQRAQ